MADINLSDPLFWAASEDDREAAFAALRREPLPTFQPEPDYMDFMPPGPGYWALVKYDDVVFVSRHPELFCSGKGSNIGDLPEALTELFGSMINMDSPKHTKLRLLVNKGFTPRMVAKVEDYVRDMARTIAAEVAPKGKVDFVTDVAAPMPLRIICDMMGIPQADHKFIFDRTNTILSGGDPEFAETPEAMFTAGWELWSYAEDLGQKRVDDPLDDITSSIVHAEIDGERLTAGEFGSFFVLLVVAGNETTRNAISHGLLELTRHPAQKEALLADFDNLIESAVEEIVRWATPVIHFRRTTTEDVELGGASIKAGEKVVLWYNSANRDEAFWDDPYRFDITRSPNEHVGFGAGGPHFCLGANLARREIRVLFEELFQRLPDIAATSEPQILQSAFIHGIKHLEAEFTPR